MLQLVLCALHYSARGCVTLVVFASDMVQLFCLSFIFTATVWGYAGYMLQHLFSLD